MKIKIEIKNGKISSYYGLFTQKERELINEAFEVKYAFKKPRNKIEYLEVRKLDNE
jgi:hypothetical protein